jgi:hypothetical protein
MGIRLYPRTTNRAAVEKLAGVPAGTYDALDALRAAHNVDAPGLDFFQREAAYEAFYDAKQASPDLDTLDSFILFGWGKVPSPHPEGFGTLEGIPEVAGLFSRHGINADATLTEGVYWG